MFKLETPDTITWPVEIKIPRDGGKTKKAEIEVEFRYLDQVGVDDLTTDTKDDIEFLSRVVTGWSGVAGSDGEPLMFSPDNLGKMLNIVYVRSAIMRGFWSSLTGAPAKN